MAILTIQLTFIIAITSTLIKTTQLSTSTFTKFCQKIIYNKWKKLCQKLFPKLLTELKKILSEFCFRIKIKNKNYFKIQYPPDNRIIIYYLNQYLSHNTH